MSSNRHQHLPFFVYGTLMRGQEREGMWPAQPTRIEWATTRGALYDLGAYPALVDGDRLVLGELWHIAADDLHETLATLDAIECFEQGGVDMYERRVTLCWTRAGQPIWAFAYFYAELSVLSPAAQLSSNSDGFCSWIR